MIETRIPVSVMILSGIQFILAGLAFFGGLSLILDPSGASMGMDPALQYIPFVTNFMPFALWLVIVFGALPLVLVYGLLTDRKWSLIGSFALGALVLIWIGTQIVLLYPMGFTYWWPGVAAIGVASLYFVLRANVRDFYHWLAPRAEKPGIGGAK